MAEVTLPELPKGKEFEEFISAYFQSSGLYVERNIVDKGLEEVLELDIITTDYNKTPPSIKLHEIKSGGWGFPDIFKLRGWIDYLKIPSALLVTNNSKDNIEFIKEKAKSLSVELATVEKLENTASALYDFYPSETINEEDVSTWRFSYWVERKLLHLLNQKKKAHKDRKSYRAIEQYYHDVSSGIFFTENIANRVEMLYDSFRKHPRLSAKCANELVGGSFDDDPAVVAKKIFSDTYYDCKINDIQISTFVEHRARLALLKSAVDFKLYEKAGVTSKTESYLEFLGVKIPSLNFLPHTFSTGLSQISEHKYFHRYPVFWQWFLYYFGGFILKDYQEQEYKLLSEKTGIPVDEIPNAFSAYQILFPLEVGWMMDLPKSNISCLRMFSVPFMGIGANVRRVSYTETGSYKDLKLTGLHTTNDLIKWNNLIVELLSE